MTAPASDREYWYRIDKIYEDGHALIEHCRVLRYTPKGVWVDTWGGKKFILASARKRYACPTKDEALESFRARKRRQVALLAAQHDRAVEQQKLAAGEVKMYDVFF